MNMDLISKIEAIRERISRNWGWVVVAAAFVIFFNVYGIIYLYGIFFVEFQAEFGSGATITSCVGVIPLALCALMAPLVNILLDYVNHRIVAVVALVFFVSGLLLTSFMPGIVPMFFSYTFLLGIGAGTLTLVTLALVIRYFPNRNCVRATGLAVTGTSLSMLCYAPLLSYLIKVYGWRVCMRICAAIAFVLGVPSVLTYSTPPAAHKIGSTNMMEGRHTQELPQTKDELKLTNDDDHVFPLETIENGLRYCGKESEESKQDTSQPTPTRGDTVHTDNTLHWNYKYDHTRKHCNRSTDPQEEPSRNISEADINEERRGKDDANMAKTELAQMAQEGCGTRPLPNPSPEYTPCSDKVPGELMGEESEGEEKVVDVSRSAIRKILEALAHPEMLMMSISVLINGIGDCFFYINLVSYMVSVGFTEVGGARVISVMGISNLVGKLLLSFAGELLPFPTVFLLVIIPFINAGIMVAFLVVRTIVPMFVIGAIIGGVSLSTTSIVTYITPQLFFGPKLADQAWSIFLFCNGIGYMCGSIIGQSIDRTGSYNSAIWAFIGMYLTSSMLFILAPLYQRVFAKHRYVMMRLYRERKNKRGT